MGFANGISLLMGSNDQCRLPQLHPTSLATLDASAQSLTIASLGLKQSDAPKMEKADGILGGLCHKSRGI
jgi:hypothetical protein